MVRKLIERRQAISYLTPLREGGSLPAVVATEPDGRFVVKFRGAGQGPKALIAELLAAGIAGVLGLPIPRPAVVTIDAGFGRGEPDPEIQDALRASDGENFGLDYLPGAFGFDASVDVARFDPELAASIVWFDAYLTNPDRTVRNPNLLWWQNGIWLIDHGASLYFHHRWSDWETRARAGFPLVKDHVLLPRAGDLAAADARLRPLLSEAIIVRVVADIPESWLSDEGFFPTIAEHREAYVTYLSARLREPRVWLEQAIDARRNA